MQEGLAALVGNQLRQAQQAFGEITTAGETGFANDDVDLARFFVATANQLVAPGPIPADVNSDLNSYGAFALLLFALKDVAETDVPNSVALLEKFWNAQPSGKFAWIAAYKPLARKYLDDCKLYEEWKKEGEEARDAAALARHLETTKSVAKKFKFHSAMYEQVAAAGKTLPRQVSDQQKADTISREQEEKKQAQEFAQEKTQLLIEWKQKLTADLNRLHYAGRIKDAAGLDYIGIDGVTADKVVARNPYGTVQLDWQKFAPKTLLDVSKSFIKPNAPDSADRQWLCAVYASETGQIEEARRLAEEAAKTKPEYRERIPVLVR